MIWFDPYAIRVRAEKRYIIRLVNSKLAVEVFFNGHVLIVFGTRVRIEIFGRFWVILGLLHRNFESTKPPRESLLNAYGYCLAHPTPPRTPLEVSLDITGCCCL